MARCTPETVSQQLIICATDSNQYFHCFWLVLVEKTVEPSTTFQERIRQETFVTKVRNWAPPTMNLVNGFVLLVFALS